MSDPERWKLKTLQWSLYRLVEAARDTMRALEAELGQTSYRAPVEELFDLTPVKDLELTTRAAQCLKNEGLKTIGEVMEKSDVELLRIPNFGKKSLHEVKEAIADHRRKQQETAAP